MISEEIRGELLAVGLDIRAMTEKFMDSEDMFRRYYIKFFEAAGEVMERLSKAVSAGDLTQVERNAHSLKGLAGNIGLGGVFDPAAKIVEDIRASRTEDYRRDFDDCRSAYDAALDISRRI
ncbi:MAG: Hpt domain-containing protein [Oscillospiraceae bacterium]|nr:Hpt domain-containing protein [Oscillospiraceae bacterium]